MSAENVELAWQVPQAWNDGGVDAVLEYLDADVEWHAPGESMEPGVYRGHDGVRDYIGRLGEVFPERHAEPSRSSMSMTSASSWLSASWRGCRIPGRS